VARTHNKKRNNNNVNKNNNPDHSEEDDDDDDDDEDDDEDNDDDDDDMHPAPKCRGLGLTKQPRSLSEVGHPLLLTLLSRIHCTMSRVGRGE